MRGDRLAVALLTAIITLLFLDVLTGASAFYSRDLSHGAYPLKMVTRETILGGEFPYWNRHISAGQPLAANPGNQVFYPPALLVLLPGFITGFSLLMVLHVSIAGWGMYALLRSMRCGIPAAFFGALSFALGGAVLGVHDFLPLFFSFVWTPLICLFARRFLLHGARRDFALAALFFGLQVLLGEATVVLQTGVLLGLYAIHIGAKDKRIAKNLGAIALLSIAALLLACVQVLPTVDHAADSVRARGFPFERVTSWSMPAARLGELLNPNLLGHPMLNGRAVYWGSILYPQRGYPFVRSVYPGILIATFALAGLLAGAPGRRLVLAALGFSVLFALGAHTPLWQLLYDTGLARSIRYPEKFILIGLFALTVFGARTLDLLLAGDERIAKAARNVAIALTLVLGAIALLALTPMYAPLFIKLWEPPARMLAEMLAASRSAWLLAAARAALLFILLRNLATVRRNVWVAVVGLVVLLDLGLVFSEVVPRTSTDFYDPPRIAQQFRAEYGVRAEHGDCRLLHIAAWQTDKAGAYFTPQPDLYWIHRNAMYPMMPSLWGIDTAVERDLDRTALLPTVDFVDATWELSRRTETWLESVAPMSNICAAAVYNDPAQAYALAGNDPKLLQPVRLVGLPPAPRYYFADAVASSRNFVEQLASGRHSPHTAFVAAPSFQPAPGVVRRVRETANTARLEVETGGRALLVMSVTPHKYWRVTVDGKETPAIVTNVGYQSVAVETAGRHVVEMRYRNPLVAIGAGISLITALALVVLARRERVLSSAPPHAPPREEGHRRPPRL